MKKEYAVSVWSRQNEDAGKGEKMNRATDGWASPRQLEIQCRYN